MFCPCGVWHPSRALAPRLPPLPARGDCGPGVGGLFFQGGSGELGSLIVLFVSQSHAVMSAVTSCSALPIGLRRLPAGPASRPPNFPCTPLRSHRPGRGSPRAAGPRRAGRAAGQSRRSGAWHRALLPRILLLLLPGWMETWIWWPHRRALRSHGLRQLETEPVPGAGLCWEPLLGTPASARGGGRGNGCVCPGAAGRCLSPGVSVW